MRWATVRAVSSLTIFSRFIAERGIDEPRLCEDRAELRLLALDYLAHGQAAPRDRCGANRGELMTGGTVRNMLNRRRAVLRVHGRPQARPPARSASRAGSGWATSTPASSAPARSPAAPAARRGRLLRRHTMAQVMRHAGLLGAPPGRAGSATSRRCGSCCCSPAPAAESSEILLLDFDLLLPIPGIAADVSDNDPDAVVAKLRYQQTKIEGAPNTILVDRDRRDHPRPAAWAHDTSAR